MTWEQEETALIAAAQTGADPEAGAQQLRLIRFANSRSGQQVMENAGAPTEMEAPTETVFLVCSDAGFFAPQRILRGDSLNPASDANRPTVVLRTAVSIRFFSPYVVLLIP